MIYTVTFNPSIDYMVSVNDFAEGKTNRTQEENMNPGGKGLNVSMMLARLGIKSRAMGFLAGFIGEEIEMMMDAKGVECDFIKLDEGCSRVNVKLRSAGSGKIISETEINGMGPEIDDVDLKTLLCKLEKLQKGDVLVLSGSIPKSLPQTVYQDILKSLENKDIKIIVDATGKLLYNALSYKPYLIKPNISEVKEIFSDEEVDIIQDADESIIDTNSGNRGNNDSIYDRALSYARRLHEMGAVNVILSLGKYGGVMVDEEGNEYRASSPDGSVVNSVGAGDSVVAGFIATKIEKMDPLAKNNKNAFSTPARRNVLKGEDLLKYCIACGSATAFNEDFATKEQILKLYERM